MINNIARSTDEHRGRLEQRVAPLGVDDRDNGTGTFGEDVPNRPDDASQMAAGDNEDAELEDDEDEAGVDVEDEEDEDDEDDEDSDGDELEDPDETTDPGAEPGKPV